MNRSRRKLALPSPQTLPASGRGSAPSGRTSTSRSKVRCREIGYADLDAIADLLTRGFVGRSRDYWIGGLRRQASRSAPEGYPRFGYMLDHEGSAVGVLLLIYTTRDNGQDTAVQCNLSSWYVEPAFRNYAALLTRIAQRHKDVTYLNISPARQTWPIIETQGFRAFSRGLFVSLPWLSRALHGAAVETIMADASEIAGLGEVETGLLLQHARYGCLSLVCHAPRGVLPFILQQVRVRRGSLAPPAMRLIYCRDIADYIACAGTIGRFLLRLGRIAVVVDCNGPLAGLAGVYTERRGRKYFKGPHCPPLVDLTDTELVLYGP